MYVHDELVSSSVSSDVNVSRLRTFIAYIHVTMLSDLNVLIKLIRLLDLKISACVSFLVLEIMQ